MDGNKQVRVSNDVQCTSNSCILIVLYTISHTVQNKIHCLCSMANGRGIGNVLARVNNGRWYPYLVIECGLLKFLLNFGFSSCQEDYHNDKNNKHDRSDYQYQCNNR